MSEQRSTPRYATDWVARYRFAKRKPWQDCQIVDLSRDGAALELHGADPERVVGERQIHVQIQSVLGVGRGAPLVADIRRRGRTPDGTVLVGVEFPDLPAEQFRLFGLLAGLGTTA
jgi:PilZ domain